MNRLYVNNQFLYLGKPNIYIYVCMYVCMYLGFVFSCTFNFIHIYIYIIIRFWFEPVSVRFRFLKKKHSVWLFFFIKIEPNWTENDHLYNQAPKMFESFFVHFILYSVSSKYRHFRISCNTHKKKWWINELLTICVSLHYFHYFHYFNE